MDTDDVVTEGSMDRDDWAWILGTVTILGFAFFGIGFEAMDSPEPNLSAATGGYLFTVLFGVGAIAIAAVMRPTVNHVPLLVGGVLAVPAGLVFAQMAEDSYNWSLGFVLSVWVAPFLIIVYGIALLVLGLTRGREGLKEACTSWGVFVAGLTGAAALYHLATLEEQARMAREAYESPGLGFALAVVTVVVAAVAARSK